MSAGAVLLASLTLVSDEEGQQAARDDVLAMASWIVVALAAYGVGWLLGLGDDEAQEVTS